MKFLRCRDRSTV